MLLHVDINCFEYLPSLAKLPHAKAKKAKPFYKPSRSKG
mgnify:CR=1 FL=1